jgi:O-antigen/teichoic acid export membrane protein
MPLSTRLRVPSWLLGSGVIAVAMGVMNVGTYGFTILAARLLGPSEYGALAAVMGLLLVVNVLSLGLQATGARRVAASPSDLQKIESEVLSASYRAALVLGAVCLLVAPLAAMWLRLASPAPLVLMAVTAVPLTIMGGQAGVLQGERRWLPLAGIYLLVGLGRLTFGLVALLVDPGATAAMAGVAIGAFMPTILGWFALRHPSRTAGRSPRTDGAPRARTARRESWARGGVLREVAHNSHALLAFFALSNADVIIARGVLDDRDAGLYAGGLILAKAVLFLPQFVVVIVFPTMSEAGASRKIYLRGLALVLGIGGFATLVAWTLPSLTVEFVGGSAYADLEPLIWAFAGVGTLLVMLQLMVYNVVARQHQREIAVVWAGLATLLVAAPLVGSLTFLLGLVVAVDACVLAVLLALSLRRSAGAEPHRDGRTAPTEPTTSDDLRG